MSNKLTHTQKWCVVYSCSKKDQQPFCNVTHFVMSLNLVSTSSRARPSSSHTYASHTDTSQMLMGEMTQLR